MKGLLKVKEKICREAIIDSKYRIIVCVYFWKISWYVEKTARYIMCHVYDVGEAKEAIVEKDWILKFFPKENPCTQSRKK